MKLKNQTIFAKLNKFYEKSRLTSSSAKTDKRMNGDMNEYLDISRPGESVTGSGNQFGIRTNCECVQRKKKRLELIVWRNPKRANHLTYKMTNRTNVSDLDGAQLQ
jgi:hypothetical protein